MNFRLMISGTCLLVFFLLFVFQLGCATEPKVEKKFFFIKRNWIKETYQKDPLDYRRLNRMRPLVKDNYVVAGNAIDQIVAFDRFSGKKLWNLEIKGGTEGGGQIWNDRIYLGASDGFFYSINLSNGAIDWKYPVKSEVLGEPVVEDKRVHFLSGNNILHTLDSQTGKPIWVYNRMNSSTISLRGASRPIVVGNMIYCGFSDGSFAALSKANGILIWEQNLNQNKKFRDVDASAVTDGKNLYISSFDGSLYSLNKDSGAINWRVDEGGYSTSLLYKNIIFYPSTSGKMIALDKDSGKVIWFYDGIKGIATEPIIYRGLLIFGESNGDLLMLDAQSGLKVDRFGTGRGVTSSPYLDSDKGQIYFMSANALLYNIQLGWSSHRGIWPWDEPTIKR